MRHEFKSTSSLTPDCCWQFEFVYRDDFISESWTRAATAAPVSMATQENSADRFDGHHVTLCVRKSWSVFTVLFLRLLWVTKHFESLHLTRQEHDSNYAYIINTYITFAYQHLWRSRSFILQMLHCKLLLFFFTHASKHVQSEKPNTELYEKHTHRRLKWD